LLQYYDRALPGDPIRNTHAASWKLSKGNTPPRQTQTAGSNTSMPPIDMPYGYAHQSQDRSGVAEQFGRLETPARSNFETPFRTPCQTAQTTPTNRSRSAAAAVGVSNSYRSFFLSDEGGGSWVKDVDSGKNKEFGPRSAALWLSSYPVEMRGRWGGGPARTKPGGPLTAYGPLNRSGDIVVRGFNPPTESADTEL
jgi:hypothetical protein